MRMKVNTNQEQGSLTIKEVTRRTPVAPTLFFDLNLVVKYCDEQPERSNSFEGEVNH